MKKYELDYAVYIQNIKMFTNDPILYKITIQRRELDELLKTTTPHSHHKDYKKGRSHDFFKSFLIFYFNDKIVEDASIKQYQYRNGYYWDEYEESSYKPYVTDFLYYDFQSNIHVAVEIDEPYDLVSKKPFHFNDENRNSFFLKHNWLIIRFAEEQVVLQPVLCCEYIKQIIHLLKYECTTLSISHDINKVERWNSQSIQGLIDNDYRNSYLKKLSEPEYVLQFELIKQLSGYNLAKLSIERPDFII